ncbi:MAG: NifB/NifX family molybdenum-iron cluster-binding protein [Candidatus Aenigmarchaeota archaeon]|nr:NifB/NifX family molybdenum-iron cluster-binding protein [Candidatus Aenigmarchaeota archaeon]
MKITISSEGKGLDSNVDSVFGRCKYFIVAEVKDGNVEKFEAIENTGIAEGGSGISAARTVAENGAEAVITGNIGPRALDVLEQFKIKAYRGSGSVQEVLQKLAEGKLERIG